MPVTRIGRPYDVSDSRRRSIGLYRGPVSYPVGGDPVKSNHLGVGKVEFVEFEDRPIVTGPSTSDILALWYDYSNEVVRWYNLSGTEITTGDDLSNLTVFYEAAGV